jgi:hypothetical protein
VVDPEVGSCSGIAVPLVMERDGDGVLTCTAFGRALAGTARDSTGQ